jgi:3,4-dihydroxy-2-butanone 4-phosphate synthase
MFILSLSKLFQIISSKKINCYHGYKSKSKLAEETMKTFDKGKSLSLIDDEGSVKTGVLGSNQVTPEMINFMATRGRGLIWPPLTENRCKVELHVLVTNMRSNEQ